MKRYKVTVTTAADGTATAYTPRLSGEVHAVHYVKTDFADGVDFTITSEATGQGIWTDTNINASEVVQPRVPTHDQTGAALLYAAGGTAVADRIAVANDRIKIEVAQGGDTKVGTFHILVN
ncbi:hypothetical protein [Ciceribacter ferrooxidans]|uniref:Uncharacterized protein n=1 Tax=Ciceribacter ferrooxidans TaxID=2509717 RepID=A0A4Q2T081_9HYPH|nr:hypothetical protein [Ciceribacter ferrooxidans]RYC10068.1 hypothetical protein EUU22_18515 [Ciceribacter ferrooxidans]